MGFKIGSTNPRPIKAITHANATAQTASGWRSKLVFCACAPPCTGDEWVCNLDVPSLNHLVFEAWCEKVVPSRPAMNAAVPEENKICILQLV